MNSKIRNYIRDGVFNVMSPSRLLNLYHWLGLVLREGVVGDVVEVGTYTGQSARLLRLVMDCHKTGQLLHVYDSFEGLEEPTQEDGLNCPVRCGAFSTDESHLLSNFQELELDPPIIHKGVVQRTLPEELPQQICFAHVDLDLYAANVWALKALLPRMAKGAALAIDDYGHPHLPGVATAVLEVFGDRAFDFDLSNVLGQQYQAVVWF